MSSTTQTIVCFNTIVEIRLGFVKYLGLDSTTGFSFSGMHYVTSACRMLKCWNLYFVYFNWHNGNAPRLSNWHLEGKMACYRLLTSFFLCLILYLSRIGPGSSWSMETRPAVIIDQNDDPTDSQKPTFDHHNFAMGPVGLSGRFVHLPINQFDPLEHGRDALRSRCRQGGRQVLRFPSDVQGEILLILENQF